jgi:hypothetical protein
MKRIPIKKKKPKKKSFLKQDGLFNTAAGFYPSFYIFAGAK